MFTSKHLHHTRTLLFLSCLCVLTLSNSHVAALDYHSNFRKLSNSLNEIYRKLQSSVSESFHDVLSCLTNLTGSQRGSRLPSSSSIERTPTWLPEVSAETEHHDTLINASGNLASSHIILKKRFQKFFSTVIKSLKSFESPHHPMFTDALPSTSLQAPRYISTFATKRRDSSINSLSPIPSLTASYPPTNVLSNTANPVTHTNVLTQLQTSPQQYVTTLQQSGPLLVSEVHELSNYSKSIYPGGVLPMFRYIQMYALLRFIADEVIKFYRQSLNHFRLIICWMLILKLMIWFITRISSVTRVRRAVKGIAGPEPHRGADVQSRDFASNEQSSQRDDFRQYIASFMTKSIERAYKQRRMATVEISEAGTHCPSRTRPVLADLDRRIYQLVNMMADEEDRNSDQEIQSQTVHHVHFRPTEQQSTSVVKSEISQNLETGVPSDDERVNDVIHASAGRTPEPTRHSCRIKQGTLSDEYDDETIRSSAGRTPAPSKHRARNVSEGSLVMTLRNGKSTPVRRSKDNDDLSSQESSSSAKRRLRRKT